MTVSEQIIQIIDALCEKFGIAIDWTAATILPYIETLCGRLITYEIATSATGIIICVIINIIVWRVVKKYWPKVCAQAKSNYSAYDVNGYEVAQAFIVIGSVIIGITTISVIMVQIFDIIKCVCFPELYVYEYISALLQ